MLGKKGERIAELCQSSGASITVHDSHEVPACGHSSDTLVTVSCSQDMKCRAKVMKAASKNAYLNG